MAKEQKRASSAPSSTPPGYGCLGVLLLPVGLWWLASTRRRGAPDGEAGQGGGQAGRP